MKVVSSIRLVRKHGKHVDQCMFEFAVESDNLNKRRGTCDVMSDLRFAGWFSESNLYVSACAHFKFNAGLNREPMQFNKNLLDE